MMHRPFAPNEDRDHVSEDWKTTCALAPQQLGISFMVVVLPVGCATNCSFETLQYSVRGNKSGNRQLSKPFPQPLKTL